MCGTFHNESSVNRSCSSKRKADGAVVAATTDGDDGGGVAGAGSITSTDGLEKEELGDVLRGTGIKVRDM